LGPSLTAKGPQLLTGGPNCKSQYPHLYFFTLNTDYTWFLTRVHTPNGILISSAKYGQFNHTHQVSPTCTPCNTCFLGPTRVHKPNGISIGSATFAQLTAVSLGMAECCWACPGMSFPLKIAALHGAVWTPSNTWFLWHTQVQIPNGIWTASAVFAQLTAEHPYISQWAAPFPLRIAISHRELDHLICGSLCPPKPSTQLASGSTELFCRAHYCGSLTD